MLHFDRLTNVTKGVLLKYRPFIKFPEPPVLQGRIHGTELPELGFGHNFPLLFSGLPHLPGFGDVPGARCFVQGDRKGGQVERPRTCIKDVLSLTVNIRVRVWNCTPLLTKSAK